jgi:5-methylcytosine-specific restriction endonuclease McrA
MITINKPTFKSEEVIIICLDRARATRVNGFTECLDQINKAEMEFESLITQNKLHLIKNKKVIHSLIGKFAMINLYNNKLRGIDQTARKYYNLIKLSAKGGICPYCGIGIVKTIDHFLPKAQYSIFSVTPINLVPCCRDCNTDKDTNFQKPISIETTHLHPYFDNPQNDSWLFMEVKPSNPLIFEYYVKVPTSMDSFFQKRFEYHLYIFELYNKFSIYANNEFQNIKELLTDIFKCGGVGDLTKHLTACFDTRNKHHKNSMETAFYFGLASNDWFCNGGFIEK